MKSLVSRTTTTIYLGGEESSVVVEKKSLTGHTGILRVVVSIYYDVDTDPGEAV